MLTLLEELNQKQRAAAGNNGGAGADSRGAGTGRRVLSLSEMAVGLHRPARASEAILAVTSQPKSEEMRNRVSALLLRAECSGATLAVNVHSLCARLLRREGRQCRMPRDFAITMMMTASRGEVAMGIWKLMMKR